jgi:hypothetical protein
MFTASPETQSWAYPLDPGDPWRVFVAALRGRELATLSFGPILAGLTISFVTLFAEAIDAPALIVAGLCAANLAALAFISLYALAEAGNPWLTRVFFTVGRRPYAPEELLEIMKKAPTPDKRKKVQDIVAANRIVRLRHMLPLRIEAERMARQLDEAKRESDDRRVREIIRTMAPL